jgi:hypothetical protein
VYVRGADRVCVNKKRAHVSIGILLGAWSVFNKMIIAK